VSEPGDTFDDRVFDPAVVVGVWAGSTRVHRGRDEFTVDFVRHLPGEGRPVLVARSILAPIAAAELRDQLDEAWRGYYGWTMPERAD